MQVDLSRCVGAFKQKYPREKALVSLDEITQESWTVVLQLRPNERQ